MGFVIALIYLVAAAPAVTLAFAWWGVLRAERRIPMVDLVLVSGISLSYASLLLLGIVAPGYGEPRYGIIRWNVAGMVLALAGTFAASIVHHRRHRAWLAASAALMLLSWAYMAVVSSVA